MCVCAQRSVNDPCSQVGSSSLHLQTARYKNNVSEHSKEGPKPIPHPIKSSFAVQEAEASSGSSTPFSKPQLRFATASWAKDVSQPF